MTTYKLNNGMTVLARSTRTGEEPMSFANMTQANKAAEKLRASGVQCWVRSLRRPFYVVLAVPAQVENK